MPIPIGTITSWGTVEAVGALGGERYYWFRNGPRVWAMMPASVVEDGWVRAGCERDGAEIPSEQGPTSTPGDDGPAESTTSADERRRT